MITKQSYNFGYPSTNTFFWTDAACTQYVKVRNDGMVAIVHKPAENSNVDADTVPFVSEEGSVTYISMPWLQDIFTLDYLYPSSEDNSCDNGACSTSPDGSYCLCPVTVSETAVFDSMPNRTEVLSSLNVGAYNPSIYSDSSSPYTLVDSSSGVEAYSIGAIGDVTTIFKVTDEYGETLYLKNVLMSVTIGSSYTMKNPVTFMNLAKIDELDATRKCSLLLFASINIIPSK